MINYFFSKLYNTGIYLYVLLIHLASLVNSKAKLWVKGRKHIFKKLKTTFQNEEGKIIWFHCASLGEFEQGRPLIEKIKAAHPEIKILLTFFSSSGYEIMKKYQWADFIFYLPADTPNNVSKFLSIIQPSLAIFVKYEFWLNFLKALHRQQIPTYLIAGNFRKEQFFFKPYGRWYLNAIKNIDYFFLQNEAGESLLQKYGINNYTFAGDPRVDRVKHLATIPPSIPIIAQFKADKKLFILGSSHFKCETIFNDFLKNIEKNAFFEDWKYVLVPHEVDEKNIQSIEKNLDFPSIRFSSFKKDVNSKILILDKIGFLNTAYQYADIAYIGGGFDTSIHNVLEPAVFALPILTGPKIEKFPEAVQLKELGGLFIIHTAKDMEVIFEKLQNAMFKRTTGAISKSYIQKNAGATDRIYKYLVEQQLL